jgi:hypothetical protein
MDRNLLKVALSQAVAKIGYSQRLPRTFGGVFGQFRKLQKKGGGTGLEPRHRPLKSPTGGY